MHDQNSKPTQVNTVYLFIIKQGGTPVKRWCEYLLLERLIISCMLHLCVWILLDAFPSIGSSIQSSIPGGISSLCEPCGFSRLFGHLWWQGLLQAGEWWWPMGQIWWLCFILHPVSFQASGDMSPQKAVALGKLKVRGNFLLLQKLQGIFWFHNQYTKINQIWFVYFGLSLSKT